MGKGKSIVDVGLAQARRPLSPRSHYFELEILDPGEKCYIALGVARRVRGGLGAGARRGWGGRRPLQGWGGRSVEELWDAPEAPLDFGAVAGLGPSAL